MHIYVSAGIAMTSQMVQRATIGKRRAIILWLMVIVSILLLARLSYLQIWIQPFLHKQGDMRMLRIEERLAMRGKIIDSFGDPVAVSTPTISVWIDPKQYFKQPKDLQQIAEILKLDAKDLHNRLYTARSSRFFYLARQVAPSLKTKLEALKIPGLHTTRDFRRFYPMGAAMSQVLGFTDIDDLGQSGFELSFNEHLKAVPGQVRVLEDRLGRHISDVEVIRFPEQGQDLKITIDTRINALALAELEHTVQKYKAKSATMVMIDIPTGRILAMVSAPSFNPNVRRELSGEALRIKAITDRFEPGSVFKAFALASTLDAKKFDAETVIDTSPGYFDIGGHTIRDIRNIGKVTVRDIIKRSSNVGISKMLLTLDDDYFIQKCEALGFGGRTNLPLPGEVPGSLTYPRDTFSRLTMGFGYGLAITPLQLANGYATLGRLGIRQDPIILDDTVPTLKTRVFSERAARATLDILSTVTEDGSGKRAAIKGYNTAGKTGTTRILRDGKYSKDAHNAFFAGVTPVDNPRLATVVLIEEPDDSIGYYGSLVAAPTYKRIVSRALQILNVPFERPEQSADFVNDK